ncbi:ketoacyl-ACP synthase III [Opitutaceae bacterium TAV4]|nr:ketoacyl-ACP synthase III [Opitutaceae bacterium TAV4]RRJ98703.1 ketoacyl-ACP synthase III [Opitutaceae bacterium TAV3]
MSSPVFAILGTGSFAPAKVLTNEELSTRVDTSDEWIVTRTGIRSRHIASETETTSYMATKAAEVALASAGLTPAQIDLLIVATCTPDQPIPSTASFVQTRLGLPETTACVDINAACTGFIYALDMAWAMLASGRYRHALIIGSERLSTSVDWTDRTTCVLFGDGAGAAVLGPSPAGSSAQIIGARLGAIPGTAGLLTIPGGGSSCPTVTAETPRFIQMKGREVFKYAVRGMQDSARVLLQQHDIHPADIACVIPHQANLRIIEAIAQYLEFPLDRFYLNLDRYGNTSAASIPIALDEARRAGRLRPGEISLLVAFGAGLTCGSALVRW